MNYNKLHFFSYSMTITAVVVLSVACSPKADTGGYNVPTEVGGTTAAAGGGGAVSGTLQSAGSSGLTTGTGTGGVVGAIGGRSGSGTSSQGGSGGTGTKGAAGQGSVVACTGQGAKLADGTCKKSAPGVYALRLDIPVYWGDKTLLGLVAVVDAGRGMVRYYGKMEVGSVCEDGKFEAKLYTCGIKLPTFYSSLLCEGYETEFPDSTWDRTDIAPFAVKGTFSGFSPGSSMALNSMDYVFGIDMKDVTGKWPTSDETLTYACSAGTGKACYPDYDRDGKPGITLMPKGGTGNLIDKGCIDALGGDNPFKRAYPPLSADLTVLTGGAARAQELYIAFRMKVGGGGKIASDCVTSGGDVPAEYLNTRAVACSVNQDLLGGSSGTKTACTDEQANFMDSQFPEFKTMNKGVKPPTSATIKDTSASLGTIATMVRLGDTDQNFSCANIRNAPFAGSQ
jgi:hypothetical protein